jgi:peptidoglycan/xylan/chitin deacetylase (PgdA/CDA1 family)
MTMHHNVYPAAYKVVFVGGLALLIGAMVLLAVIANRSTDFFHYYYAETIGTMLYTLRYDGLLSERDADVRAAATTTRAASVPVLLYHGEGDTANMTQAAFVDHMKALYAAGWRTITLEQFTAFMKGTGTVPDKSFLLTFDDGRNDTFYATDPVLHDLGFTAVMFVITGFSMPDNGPVPLVSSFFLSKGMLGYMAAGGYWELESHGDQDHARYAVPTASSTARDLQLVPNRHFLSNRFWLPTLGRAETAQEFTDRVTGDLATAQRILEEDYGRPVTAFAYPFNDYGRSSVNSPDAVRILKEVVPSLYTFAFYQTWPGNGSSFNYPDPNEYFIKRIEPEPSWTGADLLRVLNSGYARSLPYTAIAANDWGGDWGTISSADGHVAVSASPDSDGGAAFLGGSGSWDDYLMAGTFSWGAGKDIQLIARYRNSFTPYVRCSFSSRRISIEERKSEDVFTTLRSIAYVLPQSVAAAPTFVLAVSGRHVTCSAPGASVSAFMPESIPQRGGVGIEAWDPQPGIASATLRSIEVRRIQ